MLCDCGISWFIFFLCTVFDGLFAFPLVVIDMLCSMVLGILYTFIFHIIYVSL